MDYALLKKDGSIYFWQDHFANRPDKYVKIDKDTADKIEKGILNYKKAINAISIRMLNDSLEEAEEEAPAIEGAKENKDPADGYGNTEDKTYSREMLETLSFPEIREIAKEVAGTETISNRSKDAFIEFILDKQKQ